jgi:hypothetical protein
MATLGFKGKIIKVNLVQAREHSADINVIPNLQVP